MSHILFLYFEAFYDGTVNPILKAINMVTVFAWGDEDALPIDKSFHTNTAIIIKYPMTISVTLSISLHNRFASIHTKGLAFYSCEDFPNDPELFPFVVEVFDGCNLLSLLPRILSIYSSLVSVTTIFFLSSPFGQLPLFHNAYYADYEDA